MTVPALPPAPSRAETAFHEAGHAALAHFSQLLELDGDVVIDSDKAHGSAGHRIRPGMAEFPGGHAYIFEAAIVAAGGMVSQRLYLETCSLPINERALQFGAQSDLEWVRTNVGVGFFNDFQIIARSRLNDRWPDVSRLAEALIATPMVQEQQAVAILEGRPER